MADAKQDKIPADTIPKDIAKMTFEQALAELEEIVTSLEEGNVALEKSIEIYQRGNHLRRFCDDKLRQAQMKIEKITGTGDGTSTSTEPFEAE
ncbi:MAG: exodeoxyribonuclease VII small subunit [Alphaproteobacteria bacterium]|nr:exodeoxyribonuclease VII small subunit [Alphaproteobacteria bacterium]MBE8220808.1 exodeoxyribonuclease VII small subunit [Alphaproteobacteria bacterium]